jgi:hypothetical protein
VEIAKKNRLYLDFGRISVLCASKAYQDENTKRRFLIAIATDSPATQKNCRFSSQTIDNQANGSFFEAAAKIN